MTEMLSPQEVAALVARRLAERRGEFAVIGLARSGTAAVRLLRAAGMSVYASDASSSAAVRDTAQLLEREGASAVSYTHLTLPTNREV